MQAPSGHLAETVVYQAAGAGAQGEGSPEPPLIADLWALFDAARRGMNRSLRGRGQPAITVRRTPWERRYRPAENGAKEQFIAIVPLLPTKRGRFSCGAFIGTREYCRYVEPAAGPTGWRETSSGAAFDRGAVRKLFAQVFGGSGDKEP
jgi:hypothetical protein